MNLKIAGTCVTLALNDPAVASRIRQRYADFLSPSTPAQIIIQVEVRAGVQFATRSPGPWMVQTTLQGHHLSFASYLEAGSVDLHAGQGYLLMAPQGNVENFLRVLYAWCCLHSDGLLLHASGAINDGQAYIFFGPSGSGKTTATRLSSNYAILSDDLVMIRKAQGAYHAYGVPFRGDIPDVPRSNLHAPLKAVFRLRKAGQHFVQPLRSSQALAELVACVPFVLNSPTVAHTVTQRCMDLATCVPISELHFRRDSGFWEVIDDMV